MTNIPAVEQPASEWRDDDGRYLPIGVFALGYGYDPRQVAARQVPRSAAGFTGPRWRGRVISTYPHQDDVTLYLYSVLVERHGWSFIDRLLASSPQFVNGHLGIARGLDPVAVSLAMTGSFSPTDSRVMSVRVPPTGRARICRWSVAEASQRICAEVISSLSADRSR